MKNEDLDFQNFLFVPAGNYIYKLIINITIVTKRKILMENRNRKAIKSLLP